MREIKFRAWYPTNKRMIYEADFKGDGIYDEKAEFWKRRYLNPSYKVMQYTGLKDKNGKEIYEGDILKHEGTRLDGTAYELNYPVEWAWKVGYDEPGIGYNLSPEEVKEDVIIGNIYENPELLS